MKIIMADKERKKIRDTKLGQFLREKAPGVLEIVGDLLPDSGALGVVKNLLSKTEVDPIEAQRIIDAEVRFQENVTERWKADMISDVRLTKLIRPYTLIALMVMFIGLAVADSIPSIGFEVKEVYVSLLQTLTMTAFGAYFAGRSLEKIKK
jgi:hypothetical protein|tara:strand:+ start:421 stop:873 length:453 start_codon:yes stop_codon:yes gene_type:complete